MSKDATSSGTKPLLIAAAVSFAVAAWGTYEIIRAAFEPVIRAVAL